MYGAITAGYDRQFLADSVEKVLSRFFSDEKNVTDVEIWLSQKTELS